MSFAALLENLWNWWTQSGAGLVVRIALGIVFFLVLAIWDYRKHRHQARRWREYTFLLACVAAAICYGIVNDQITSTLSWEYFYYGKDLASRLGPHTPPDPLQLHLAAALVGIQATWAVGLVLGAMLLIANNPTRRFPSLCFAELFRAMIQIFMITAAFAVLGGVLGGAGAFTNWSEDFSSLAKENQWRPYRFMAVYGIHLGGYAGSLSGAIYAIIRIIQKRRKLRESA